MSKKRRLPTPTELLLGSIDPRNVEGQRTVRTEFYRNLLLRKMMTIFELGNMPDRWDRSFFWRALYRQGWVAIAATEQGIIPVNGAFSGYDVYGYPTEFEVANPVLRSTRHKIGETAEIVYLENVAPIGTFSYTPPWRIIDYYAEQLASCDCSIGCGLMNSRVSAVFICDNAAQAQTAKLMYDKISSGEPAVFLRGRNRDITNVKQESFVPVAMDVKGNFVGDLILDMKRSIMNEFLTLIGINNAPVDKKERVQNAETDSNNIELINAVDDWYQNLKDCLDKVNRTFVINVTVTRPYIDTLLESKREEEDVETTMESDSSTTPR